MADIDQMLRESFHRLAEPGDPTGVAEAVRSRVEAGDLGTPSDSGSGFGSGTFTGGGWTWVMGAGAIAGIGGLVLGASGFLGTSATAETPPTSLFSVTDTTPGLDCPGGARVASFHPGDRVLAVARSDDGDWLAVRNPVDRADTVWVALDELVLDEGQPEVGSLEVDGCPMFVAAPLSTAEPEPEIVEPEPEIDPGTPMKSSDPPASDPEPDPKPKDPPPTGPTKPPTESTKPPTEPPPDPDTTAPTLSSLQASAEEVWCGDELAVTVTATDDTAVERVTVRIGGADHSVPEPIEMGHLDPDQQEEWWLIYQAPGLGVASAVVTFEVQAFDAAENATSAQSVDVVVKCLI